MQRQTLTEKELSIATGRTALEIRCLVKYGIIVPLTDPAADELIFSRDVMRAFSATSSALPREHLTHFKPGEIETRTFTT